MYRADFKEKNDKIYSWNQKKNSGTHNDGSGLGKFYAPRTHLKYEDWSKIQLSKHTSLVGIFKSHDDFTQP